jgi:hypothetical protein
MRRLLVAAVLAGLSATAHAGPVPPCGAPPTPAFGELNGAPHWRMWSADELRAEGWQPAACLGWAGGTSGATRFVAAVASRFRSRDDVFQRLLNIAAWPAIRYWSVSHQSWQPLAVSVSPVDGDQFRERDENGGDIVYSMRVLRRDAAHLTVATENLTPIRIAIITAFEPSSLQTVTFVERAGADQWSTFQVTRVGAGASAFVLGYKGSFLNRLEAVRRYLAGLPADRQPPLAPR